MQLEPNTTIHGFSIVSREPLVEIDGEAIMAVHDKSGAKLLYLKNDDNNKSFAIGFKTPPKDDTGVFHILEHSVLCGSRRFPVKEPFVDLLKGSMQTFLNAMTFPDKTLYPVASTNEQDLFNLMDVYLDAVFHPRIYEKRAIFEQEGWHYELHAKDGHGDSALNADETELSFNGVVFNEMKGALSDASSVLYDEVQKALFPDTPYAFESGGTPEAIPTLTYEEYLDEHRRHYRTDNSYIVLYGNMDADRTLAFLDERYLAPVADEQGQAAHERAEAGLEPLVPRTLEPQGPRKAGYVRKTMDTAAENACAACGYVIGTALDRTRVMGTDVLLDALFGSNEAPCKRALLDKGVAHDVTAFVADAVLQPFAVVQANMPAEECGEQLDALVAETVRTMLENGLDKRLVEAALSHMEFQLREHELGMADGVAHAISSLTGWLYDDDAACLYLRYEDAIAELRAALESDYFERLCAELFLDNDHTAHVEVVPTPGQGDDELAQRLSRLHASLSDAERRRIVEEEALLRELQESPDTPEAIATLPRLSVDDIGAAPSEPAFSLDANAPIPCLRHSVATHGIVYAYRYFDENRLSFDEIPYAAILALILGKLDTARHTAAELDTLMQSKLGNLTFFSDMYGDQDDASAVIPKFVVSASALADNVDQLAELPREIMLETDFSNKEKILDVLKQRKIGMEQAFINAGHSCASSRLKSYYSGAGILRESISGVDFYRFLCDLIEHYEERADALAESLAAVAARLFCDDNCTVSFAGTDDDYDRFWKAGPECGRTGDGRHRLETPKPTVRNEAFTTPSDVCFAAVGWDRRLLGSTYTGTWPVASKVLSLDYLWNEVRVKGGAYGVGYRAMRSGSMTFYSYRDPHLDSTLERFAQSCDWLSSFDPSQEDLEGFIVATVAKIDAPIKPRMLIRRQAGDYFSKRTHADLIAIRNEAISSTREQIRDVSADIRRAVDQGARCVFGNKAILEASNAGFEIVELIGA